MTASYLFAGLVCLPDCKLVSNAKQYPIARFKRLVGKKVKGTMSSNEDLVASVLAGMGRSPGPEANASPAASGKPDEKAAKKKKGRRRAQKSQHKFPVEPRVIQIIEKPKTVMNHSYRDFSSVPPEMDYVEPTTLEEIMTFSQRVHHMLSQDEYKNWICWCSHGRAFRILVPKRLEQGKVLFKYFGHNRYSSFLRQLNNHGFKHLAQGRDRNCYYHEVRVRSCCL